MTYQLWRTTLDDIITATGSAFLGMSISCSRCHDHKFDPIEQKDYYRMRAVFEGIDQGARVIASSADKKAYHQTLQPLQASQKKLQQQLNQLEKAPKQKLKAQHAEFMKDYPRPPVQSVYTEENFSPILAQHVRFTVIAPSRVMIEEFEVWSSDAESKNLALKSEGASVSVSSMRYSNDDPEAYGAHHLNDGELGSFWISQGANSSLTLTLKEPSVISKVVFSNNRTKTKARTMPNAYKVEVSTDGETWKEVATHQGRKPQKLATLDQLFLKRVMTQEENQKHSQLKSELRNIQNDINKVKKLPLYWAGKFKKDLPQTHLLKGGDVTKEIGVIPPEGLHFLSEVLSPFTIPKDSEGVRRLQFANWLVDEANPLTSRVLANRIWQHHFGRGIVATPSDFGYMGARPTHPELLDWLALQLKEHQWKLKPLHRMIMLSETYQQSSAFDKSKHDLDADSAYLWRYPPRRLEAEAIRDTLLYASGLLNKDMYGPGFRLYQYTIDNVATYYTLDELGPETYRRAVYHQTPRSVQLDLMTEYDMPDCSISKPKRNITVSPLQALTHLNHRFVMDLSKAFAKRLETEQPNGLQAQIERAYLLLFSRPPEQQERELAVELIQKHSLLVFCRALLNANEVIYVD